MNVVCGQCGTGYEFDDALVSERGTTVRCMHCGHQFRVHSPRAKAGVPERWIVRKASGEEYIFRSLSELQRAIAQRRVVIKDSFSRDGLNFRRMSELSELESFFGAGQKPRSVPVSAPVGTPGRPEQPAQPAARLPPSDPLAVTPTAAVSVAVPTPRGGFTSAPPEAKEPTSRSGNLPPASSGRSPAVAKPPSAKSATVKPSSAPASSATSTPVVTGSGPATEKSRARPDGEGRSAVVHVESRSAVVEPQAPTVGVDAPTLASEVLPSSELERVTPGTLPRRRRNGRPPSSGDEPPSLAGRISEPSHVSGPISASEHRAGPKWILALVLLGGLALVAGTVGRDYFERFRENQTPAAQVDTRVESFLAAGDELFRTGDLEEARAQYEKASALAEREPGVLQRLLQVETTRGDVEWLRLRVLPKSSPERAVVAASLQERTSKIQRRVEEYQSASATTTPAAEGALAVVDALRVQGKLSEARTLIQQTSGLSNDANSAYVSAMLDVSDVNPNWASIVARLKLAVSGERGLGRAQAALVYSLISAGQLEDARQQLDVLVGLKRPSPLLTDLQTLLNATPPGEVKHAATTPEPVPSSTAVEAVGRVDRSDRGGQDNALRSDDPMAEAAEARAAGELSRAARLYTLALSKNPGNVLAMTGLGDVARSQGSTDIALSHYGAALRVNPTYAPAVLASADLKWSLGDRSGAVELYRRLGAGGPPRVADRIAEFDKSSTPKPSAAPDPAPSPNAPVDGTPGPAQPPASELQPETP